MGMVRVPPAVALSVLVGFAGCSLSSAGVGELPEGDDDLDGVDAGPDREDGTRRDVDGDMHADADGDAGADRDADPDVEGDTDADTGCTVGAERCSGDILERCSPAGVWEVAATCSLGCVAVAGRCAEIVPSGGIDPAWVDAGTAPLEPVQDVLINTDSGAVTAVSTGVPIPGAVFNVAAPVDCGGGRLVGAGVFSFSAIDIPDGVTVRAVGTNALALLASGPATIAGLIDVRGGLSACGAVTCAGPGGFAGGLAGDASAPGDGPGGGGAGFNGGYYGNEAGGGGGGSCGSGGSGGSASVSEPGGAGGGSYPAAALAPLCGGSGGGSGAFGYGGSDLATQHGGGGGGAVQIVSAVSVSFLSTTPASPSGVNAGGGGGRADHLSTYDDGGGGGGAGGAILVEAPTILVEYDAVLAAGGGGGAGGYNGGMESLDGADGLLADAAAPGGGGFSAGGPGGAGAGVDGGNATGTGDGGAGGGGGAGRIRLATRPASPSILRGTVSPHAGSECFSEGAVGSR